MAISTTTINGTDSVASSRITINDNFNTIKDAINELLLIIDTATGKINNYGFGSNNDIETEDLIVRGSQSPSAISLSVLGGSVRINQGNLEIGNGILQIGSGSNAVQIQKVSKTTTASVTVPTINFSGSLDTANVDTPVKLVSLPRLSSQSIKSIQNPAIGSIVYSTDQNKLVLCTATGATGTWTIINTGSDI